MKSTPSFRNILAVLTLVATALGAQAQVPGIITYQGRVTTNGAGFTGNGQFRFVIYRNAPGPVTHWSHDNSSVGGGMPLTALSLPVSNGLFSVGLGDITVQGMQTQIAPAIFANNGLRLRIWFSDGVSPAAVIADHPFTSTGYAMFAAGVPDGSITSAKIASGAVTSAQLADNIQLTSLNFLGDGVGTVDLLASTSAGQGARFTMRNGLGAQTAVLDGDASGRAGSLALYNNTNKLTVLVDGDEGSGLGGIIQVFDNAGAKRAELDGQGASGGGELGLLDADGTNTVSLRAAEASTRTAPST